MEGKTLEISEENMRGLELKVLRSKVSGILDFLIKMNPQNSLDLKKIRTEATELREMMSQPKYEFYRRNQVYKSLKTRINAGQVLTSNFYHDLMIFGKNVLGISDFPAVPEYLEKEQNIEEVIGSLE